MNRFNLNHTNYVKELAIHEIYLLVNNDNIYQKYKMTKYNNIS